DRRITDTTAAEDRDCVATGNTTGVERRAESGHHAAAEQTGGRGRCLRIDLRALTRVHERLLDERSDTERRRQRRPVFERHLLRSVVGVEAVPRAAAQTCTALT